MPKKPWSFITSHGYVLAYIASHKQVRGIDIALDLGLTERSVRRIISDLESEGYITKKKVSWYNQYKINTTLPLRREMSTYVKIGSLLKLLTGGKNAQKRG